MLIILQSVNVETFSVRAQVHHVVLQSYLVHTAWPPVLFCPHFDISMVLRSTLSEL